MHWEDWKKKAVQRLSWWYTDGVLEGLEQSGT
jgi:hypothetical protein